MFIRFLTVRKLKLTSQDCGAMHFYRIRKVRTIKFSIVSFVHLNLMSMERKPKLNLFKNKFFTSFFSIICISVFSPYAMFYIVIFSAHLTICKIFCELVVRAVQLVGLLETCWYTKRILCNGAIYDTLNQFPILSTSYFDTWRYYKRYSLCCFTYSIVGRNKYLPM